MRLAQSGRCLLHGWRQCGYLVHRLAYNGDVAASQLAVFQGGPSRTGDNEAPISGFMRVERATRKNSQLAAARRVGLKMGRRLRCSSVAYRSRYARPGRCRLICICSNCRYRCANKEIADDGHAHEDNAQAPSCVSFCSTPCRSAAVFLPS
jgi:hypothetical protein